MRLSTRAASLLCAVSLLLPIGASATTAKNRNIRLRDIIDIVQANTKPLSFDATLKGSYGKNKGTLTIKGTQNGDMKTLEDAAADMTVGIDLSLEDGSSIKSTMKIIIIDSTLYFNMQELILKGDMAKDAEKYKQYLDTWISMPAAPAKSASDHDDLSSSLNLSQFDQFFTITKSNSGDTTTYSVTIPKEKQRRLIHTLFDTAGGYTSAMRAYTRGMARNTSIGFDATVITVQKAYASSSAMVTFKTKFNTDQISFSMNATAKTLKAKQAIIAPPKSTSLETLQESFYDEQMDDARNAQRFSDVNTILNAMYQYSIDNDGKLPVQLTPSSQAICATNKQCNGVSLDTLTEAYLVRIPVDPDLDYLNSDVTGYTILKNAQGRITITAPLAKGGTTISVTR